MATTNLMTIEDLAELEATPGRYDLIRGELIEMSPAGYQHGILGMRIARRIADFAEEHGLGEVPLSETGFILSRNPDVLLAPDVSFIRSDRLPSDADQLGYLELAPELVVEVLSPSDRQRDVTRKIIEYLDAGVQIVWLVDPADTVVTVFTPERKSSTLTINDELDGGDVLPGFRLPLADIFR